MKKIKCLLRAFPLHCWIFFLMGWVILIAILLMAKVGMGEWVKPKQQYIPLDQYGHPSFGQFTFWVKNDLMRFDSVWIGDIYVHTLATRIETVYVSNFVRLIPHPDTTDTFGFSIQMKLMTDDSCGHWEYRWVKRPCMKSMEEDSEESIPPPDTCWQQERFWVPCEKETK